MKLFKKQLGIGAVALVLVGSFPSFASNGAGTEPPKKTVAIIEKDKSLTLCDVLPLVCELIPVLNSNGAGTEPQS